MENNLESSHNEEIELLPAKKFVFLFIVSLGLYNIWWMFKVWKIFRNRENSDIMPAARAIFAIFFLHSLFDKVQELAKSKGYTQSFSSTAYFIGFVAFNMSSRLPGGLWVISFLSVLCLLPALEAFNYGIKHSGEYKVIEDESFNQNQIILIVIGTIIWLFSIVGMFSTEV
jgi:hypothetical protein